LACFHYKKHTAWHTHISELQFALNSAVHKTTKFSPAEIFLGRQLSSPGDNAVLNISPSLPESIAEKVKKHMKNMADKNKTPYDETRSDLIKSI
jgi:hypothetical protein